MIIHWQRVGFVHGVMNTDNLSILGLTIDYGPYGWLEGYDPNWTPNTTDRQFRRYRFGNQPQIAQWNLYQLANALYSFIDESDPLQEILDQFNTDFHVKYLKMMRGKLGLQKEVGADRDLISGLEKTLQLTETDMTLFFRLLNQYSASMDVEDVEALLEPIKDAFYVPTELKEDVLEAWHQWLAQYVYRLQLEEVSDTERKTAMNATNPKYVLRNYIAQMVIDEADKGNLELLNEVFELLKKPYDEQPEMEKWFAKRPEWLEIK